MLQSRRPSGSVLGAARGRTQRVMDVIPISSTTGWSILFQAVVRSQDRHPTYLLITIVVLTISVSLSFAQNARTSNDTQIAKAAPPNDQGASAKPQAQINVNWLYGSYVPKDVPLESLNTRMRWKLYLRQTYTTPGIYIKTLLFATHDQVTNSNPQWGDGFEGFAKRLGNRQVQFIIQNSVSSLGNGIVGWEPRYDRCHCDGFWPRTRHAIVRNFVTYDRTERPCGPN